VRFLVGGEECAAFVAFVFSRLAGAVCTAVFRLGYSALATA
jgi:hypothetical protein